MDWRFTTHALDRMAERDVDRATVLACLETPTMRYPGASTNPGSEVARCGDITVVFNPTTREVITVHCKEEPDVSGGWVNLSSSEAEKLLRQWGFEIHTRKGTGNLWKHPMGEPLIPFSDPSSRRQNGSNSFKAAAGVVGVTLKEFLKGPTAEWFARNGRAIGRALDAAEDQPHPLGAGVGRQLVEQQRSALIQNALSSLVPKPQTIPALPEVDEHTGAVTVSVPPAPSGLADRALEAITDEALTAPEVAILLECSTRHARDILGRLVDEGKAVRRKAQAHEVPGVGQPPWLYLAGNHHSEIPFRKPTITVELEPTPEETPMPVESTSSLPAADTFVPSVEIKTLAPENGRKVEFQPLPRVFEEVGPWPMGGVIIKDDAGNLYVARKLVEEGR